MIISQDGVKRALAKEKPYLLILSRDEARALREQLTRAAEDDFWYGAVTIYPFSWCESQTNSAPLPWIP
jgi:hypothetical protein